ncbi:FtsX-like permease family protein [Streptomyces alkaliterrae]|uniref:ABC transporter permease n=1 Tax=Streptomyces alkaliterrae TaxID=2213162 RepID=A0A5P0YQB9_9ACTN|nr:ABC transporter permease [Streptomyces alkaliterrae]MBB1259927.1 ABC transporter permease [Streptomyces alkaliterrae]MQS02501.1 FtsX-like permease family protein [Streptomyces alkaliterrae]
MGTFVLLRARTHRLLITAALLTVLLATAVLTTLTAFTSAVGDAGLGRSLEKDVADRAIVSAQGTLRADDRANSDRAVRAGLEKLFGGLPVAVESSVQSERFTLPDGVGRSGGEEPDLTLFATFERSRMKLVDGSWPAAPGSGRVPALLSERAAEQLGLSVGDRLTVTGRQGLQEPQVRVEISGVYRPEDGRHPYWRLDPLGGRGAQTLSFTTYGPLVVHPAAFDAAVPPQDGYWQADADFSALRTTELAGLTERVSGAVAGFGVDGVEVTSELPRVLDSLDRSLLVTRSTLLIAAVQLALLAGLALLLVARLLASERATETALLRARGGSRRTLARLAAAEALLLVLPAALLGPLLVRPVVGWLTGSGPLAEAGVELTPELGGSVWLTALATALAAALMMTAPALRPPGAGAGRRRRAAVLRGGADLALVVLAGVAYLQLLRRRDEGGVLGGEPGGALAVDPVLVAAPALALLAGTVLALRLLPPLARLAERRAARGRSLVGPLAGWQLSRRPARGAAPATLLVLAVAMGVFSLGQSASWERSQRDQADFGTGADIMVTGWNTPDFGQGGVFDEIAGVRLAAPVARSEFSVREGRTTRLLATDTRYTDKLLHMRSDLADGPFATRLTNRPDDAGGVELAEGATRIGARLTATAPGGGKVSGPVEDSTLTAVVEDRHGLPYRFRLGTLTADDRTHGFRLDPRRAVGEGSFAGPLRLVRLVVEAQVPYDAPQRHRLSITGLSAAGGGWSADLATSNAQFMLEDVPGGRPKADPVSADGGGLTVEWVTGAARQPGRFFSAPDSHNTLSLSAEGTPPGPPPAVVTDAYLTASGAKVGDEVRVQVSGTDVTVRIVGAVRELPTAPGAAGSDGGAVLVDLAALDRALDAAGSRPLPLTDWWVGARAGATEKVAERLRARADVETVLVREEVAAQLRADPLGAGPRAALGATAVAAALLASTGFAVSVAGSVRERAREFAVLRALGTSRRQLARVVATEHAVLVALSLVVGTALGVLLLRLVLPLVVLTSDATRPVPALLVEVPLGPLGLLLAAVAVVPLLSVALIAMRRGDAAGALREQGEH